MFLIKLKLSFQTRASTYMESNDSEKSWGGGSGCCRDSSTAKAYWHQEGAGPCMITTGGHRVETWNNFSIH